MISGIQAVVMAFAVIMTFVTYNFYRRKQFAKLDLALWCIVWAILFLAGLFPDSVGFIVQTLHIERGFDFFTILGFIFLLIVVFYLYGIIFRMQKKIETLISTVTRKTRYRKK